MKKITTNYLIFIGFTWLLLLSGSCDMDNRLKSKEVIEIDFEDSIDPALPDTRNDTLKTLKVAVAAIISPKETFHYYRDLFDYISEKTGMELVIVQRKTYNEVNLMLENKQVDIAFICSGAYILESMRGNIKILAIPVCNGKPFYQAYIITHVNSGIEKFDDFNGKSFAFTDPLSNSGRLYALKRVKELSDEPETFFSKTLYTHGHDISIQMVSKNIIAGATIDGLIYDYLAKHTPERIENIKVIEKSEYFGIPPIVYTLGLDETIVKNFRAVLLNIHNDPAGINILHDLMIDRFIEGQDSSYNSIRKIQDYVSN